MGRYMYKQATRPDYTDPGVEAHIETISLEMTKVRAWALACKKLQVIRFPSKSKWIVIRENGGVFPRMELL
jgi:hypothetical protein